MKRRKFIKKAIYSTLGFAAVGGLYSWQIEPYWLEFVHRKMPLQNLPKYWQGKTLMQISDMHVGNRVNSEYLKKSLQKAQAFYPDIVVYTGDFVHYEDEQQWEQLKEVLQYTVTGKEATLGVLGNHDYGKAWSEMPVAQKITNILQEHNIEVLRNEKKEIKELHFYGIDDYWSPNCRPSKALEHYTANQASICLCHNPDVCDLNVWNGFQGWILSGHTHGGQCKPPFLKAPILPVQNENYDQGVKDLGDGRHLYINRAVGFLWQVRCNVRPEITLFTLESV